MALPDHHDFTDDPRLCEVFNVFEEIRENNEVPDVVITVRLFDFNLVSLREATEQL